ncbi:MAG: hypothetical protein HZA91_11555 [Verrucomicrobia bacterium]|nr:hypothetical protein [Verrucomicrobiota bacterium]
MRTMKHIAVAGAAVVIVLVGAGIWSVNRPAARVPAQPDSHPPARKASPSAETMRVSRSVPWLAAAKARVRPRVKAPRAPAGRTAPQPKDELARAALSLVGVEPEAEQYWIKAINNPDLPANERQDLIEDLNEDGLSDPKRPTTEDLPVILKRLKLVEELAPDAMDKVNADAFKEAHKDLENLARVAVGAGKPVK